MLNQKVGGGVLPPKMDGVNFMENLIKMDDLGGPPLFSDTPIYPLVMAVQSP